MKFIINLMLIMLLCLVLSAGCIPVTPAEGEPEPGPVLSVDVNVAPHPSCADCICYTIENIGDVSVNYELTFVVKFVPGNHTEIAVVVESEEKLEVGEILSKCVKVVCSNPSGCTMNPNDYEILSISTTYELWE